MKHSILLITSIFILVITEGCHKKSISSNEPQEVVITGQITNKQHYDPNTLAIIINDEKLRTVNCLKHNNFFYFRFD